VVAQQLGEAPVGEDPLVLPAGVEPPIASQVRQRVADAGDASGDVGEGKGLPPEHERGDVVPAGQVLGGKDQQPTGPQDAERLGDEGVRVVEMLEDLVGSHEIEGLVRQWQGSVEVRLCHPYSCPGGPFSRGRVSLDPVAKGLEGKVAEGGCPVPASEIEDGERSVLPGRLAGDELSDLVDVVVHGCREQALA
jgi:hypothetical protein